MRINVYAEELTNDCEIVTKTVTDDEFGTRTFYGIRVYLKSPPELHHSEEDDDRSAITFWTLQGGHNFWTLMDILDNLVSKAETARETATLWAEPKT